MNDGTTMPRLSAWSGSQATEMLAKARANLGAEAKEAGNG